jgi:hypothetical protein
MLKIDREKATAIDDTHAIISWRLR